MNRRSITAVVLAAACTIAIGTGEVLADYPEKPITVIVPNKAGGGLDLVVRIVSDELSNALGQPVVVKNMPGAGTAIGSRAANEAVADGYTVLVNHEALITQSALGRLGFDINGLEPLAKTGGFANFLAASSAAPFASYAELCKYAKAHPGEVTAAVQIGALSHFHMMSAAGACGIDLNFVNTTGGGAAFRAGLMGGTLDLAPMPAMAARGLKESGDIKVLAFLGVDRHPAIPDVPTTSEMGFDAAEGDFNFYWWVRKEVPDQAKAMLVRSLEAGFSAVTAAGKLSEMGMANPEFLSGEALRNRIADKIASISEMARAVGLVSD